MKDTKKDNRKGSASKKLTEERKRVITGDSSEFHINKLTDSFQLQVKRQTDSRRTERTESRGQAQSYSGVDEHGKAIYQTKSSRKSGDFHDKINLNISSTKDFVADGFHAVKMQLNSKSLDSINSLQEKFQANNGAEVVTRAVDILKMLFDKIEGGSSIIVKDKNGDEYKLLINGLNNGK
ncbi:hypothetical protein [Piscirickettsia salmonis]|uniref:hypothetical protein n=1 Tax=Piscirickettsia salmonis TaxID=1238 RepID=UPI0012BA98C2|nr:hypothetical protein [Piscirickettsia salmonis]QGP41348.1 hypothetical protein Psal182_03558 [Piscirickettsia salmonis]